AAELGADSRFIARRRQQIALQAPGSLLVDVNSFEELAAEALNTVKPERFQVALRFYSGDLLAEDLYEDWVWNKREQLRILHQGLLSKLAQLYQEKGLNSAAIEVLNALLSSEPANEDAHRRLMLVYAESGHRQQALRQYLLCREAVRRELDAEPEEATRSLHDRIVAGKVAPHSRQASDQRIPLESLAVLPFTNTTDDPELEYLCEGIAESLIHNLSQLLKLRIMALSTVLSYRGQAIQPQVVGRDLAVEAILLGRVLHWSQRLIIGTELVRVGDGSLLWGEKYNRSQDDIFEVQEEISREISERLKLELTGPEKLRLSKRHTDSAPAYQLYLKGRHHWNKRTAEGLQKGIRHFQQAIDEDPTYALAFCGLADCYNLLSLYSVVPPSEAMPRARSAAVRALEIDEDLAEAHTSLAYSRLYYDWDWKGAEEGFQRALELNPSYATAHHWYHEYLTATGRFQEQREAIRRAEELDPLSLIIKTEVGWGLYYARQYDRAVHHLKKTLEMESSFAVAHYILGLVRLQQGQFAEAVSDLERTLKLLGDKPFILALGALGHAYALLGDQAGARS
ncbi:MAG: BTAD domain-containing putative transcriptional regulator, partial [Acidobacteriota bacterium]